MEDDCDAESKNVWMLMLSFFYFKRGKVLALIYRWSPFSSRRLLEISLLALPTTASSAFEDRSRLQANLRLFTVFSPCSSSLLAR